MTLHQFRISDNHQGQKLSEWKDTGGECFTKEDKANFQFIANTRLQDLVNDNPDLLVFPDSLGDSKDKIGDLPIITLSEHAIQTGNLMGFVGVNDTQLNIHSRFAKSDKEDYFLHYMLLKVFAPNLVSHEYSLSREPVFDFLIYLFPYYLKQALRQGLFRQYRWRRYNDANVRGPIDVARHIRENIPFRGTIAYSTREHSSDNSITQLIRHTIEYIRQKPQGSAILQCDADTKNYVSQIVQATPTYSKSDRQKVINDNLRPVHHPYFLQYKALQRICLQILRHQTIKYGNEKDKVYGIIFDGAWLWEEYLYNAVLELRGFTHAENKEHRNGFKMFEKSEDDDLISKNSRRLYPDFYTDEFILDAKYKHLNKGVGREDLYQVVTYMYVKRAMKGGYIYPSEKLEEPIPPYMLKGYNGTISIFPFYVPQKVEEEPEWTYESFCQKIQDSEGRLKQQLVSIQDKEFPLACQ